MQRKVSRLLAVIALWFVFAGASGPASMSAPQDLYVKSVRVDQVDPFVARKGCEYQIQGDRIGVQWDPSPGASHYEVKLIMFDKDPVTEWDLGTTTDTRIMIKAPMAGHFKWAVRAVDESGNVTTWAETTDPLQAMVDGENMAWWVLIKPLPPGGIIVD